MITTESRRNDPMARGLLVSHEIGDSAKEYPDKIEAAFLVAIR
jgi:hypothetical protein